MASAEPSNAASDSLRLSFDWFNQCELTPGDLRLMVTDDFTYEDRRRGPTFPRVDAESYQRFVASIWETGAGRPRFAVLEVLAVRGERFAAAVVELDYGNGMMFESIEVIGLDPTLGLAYRSMDFDRSDLAGAIAELDRLHSESDAR